MSVPIYLVTDMLKNYNNQFACAPINENQERSPLLIEMAGNTQAVKLLIRIFCLVYLAIIFEIKQVAQYSPSCEIYLQSHIKTIHILFM